MGLSRCAIALGLCFERASAGAGPIYSGHHHPYSHRNSLGAAPYPDSFTHKPPTPTATWVPPPNILPETLNADEPTPIPIATSAGDGQAVEPIPTATPAPQEPAPADTPDQYPLPTPTATSTPQPAPPPVTAPDPVVAGGGIPTRLVIPSVGIDANVIEVGWQLVEQNGQQYSIWQVADYAVGWHETSARLGQPGNTVMAGHHNVNGEVFRDLVNVEVGDEVDIYSGDQKFSYRVELKTIVKEKGEP
ncbi:MAG: sortase [Anaerolineae bacterium]